MRPRCPECNAENLTSEDFEGLIDCRNCGLWFEAEQARPQGMKALTCRYSHHEARALGLLSLCRGAVWAYAGEDLCNTHTVYQMNRDRGYSLFQAMAALIMDVQRWDAITSQLPLKGGTIGDV